MTSAVFAGAALLGAPIAATVVIAALPSQASAQDYSSGVLAGTVTDSSGAPLAGATVVVKSQSQGGERNLTTDERGQFRAPLIPIGGYSVAISKPGYQSTKDGNLAVRLGSQSNYGFTLAAEGEVDAVVVTGTANPQLDFSGATTGLVVDVDTLSKQLPIARNVTALTLLAPSAVPGDSAFTAQGQGQASVSGASVGENIFYINGLNITNFINGVGAGIVPFDFYKTLEVKTGGYQAEYGRGTGGMINAVTKSGGNDFTFAVHGNYEPGALREEAPDTFQTSSHLGRTDIKSLSAEASGPIIKDHLFFYGLVDYTDTRTTVASPTAGYYGKRRANDPFYGLKLDGFLTDRQHFELTYFDTTQTRAQVRRPYSQSATGQDVIDTAPGRALTVYDEFGGPSWVGRYTGAFTDWFTLSGAYGKTRIDNGSFTNQTNAPNVQDARSGTTKTISTQTAALFTTPSRAEREFYRVDADFYFHLVGDHHVRGGVDHEKTSFLNFSSRNGAGTVSKLGQSWLYRKNRGTTVNGNGFAPGQEYLDLRTFDGGGVYEGVNEAMYIQDAWDVTDRLHLNLGYRIDKLLQQDDKGRAFSNFDNEKALRLGFTWDPTGAQTDKVYGSYGRYYLPTPSNTAYRAASNNLDVRQYYLPANGGLTFTVDPITGLPVGGLGAPVTRVTNPTFTALGPCTQAFIDRGIAPITAGTRACSVGSSGETPPPESISALNLKSTAEDEFIVGYEHRFDNLWKAGVSLTYRNLLRAADDAAIDAAVIAYCKANNLPMTTAAGDGCEDNWGGTGQYLIINPGSDVKAVLYTLLPGETTIRTLDLKASDLGFPKAKREYTALTFTFERAFDGKWGLQGSYVLSESKGNYEGAVKSDTGQADAGITSDFDLAELAAGTYGLLPNHHAHQFKAFGSYAVTENLLLGANASVISPRKYGCQGLIPADLPGASTANTYNPLPGRYCGGKLIPRGSAMNGDWISRLDVSLRYTVPAKIIPAGNLVLRADIFNVLNAQGAQELYETGELASGGVDPHYGEPGSSSGALNSGYQTPRYVRFGFDLSF